MAPSVPAPLLVVLLAAAQTVLVLVVFPQFLPENPFAWTFIRFISLNFGLWTIWRVFIYPFYLSPLRHLPMPKGGYPIIAHGLEIFDQPPGRSIQEAVAEVPNDGLVNCRGYLYKDQLLVTDPKTIAEVLVHKCYDFEKPVRARNFLASVLGDGLVLVEGDEHKFQRKHIMPAFSFRHIKDLYPLFWSKAIEFNEVVAAAVRECTEEAGGEKPPRNSGVIEMKHYANKVTMDIIGVAGLGRNINSLHNPDDELMRNFEEITAPTFEQVIYFAAYISLPTWLAENLPLRIARRRKITAANVRNIGRDFVKEKKELIRLQSDDHKDILSVLIKSNDFSDDMLVDQALTFLAAGHETTSSAFTWTSYLLATHASIQNRLRDEIGAAIPSTTSPPPDLAATLESLPLLNAVCNEVLRLYPTVPVTLRNTVRTTSLCGVTVPAGTRVAIAPWAINRSPHLWGPDSCTFVPDRWIDKATGQANNHGGATSNYSNMTFLHGPRSCIGQSFAKAELRALVAAFVSAFEIELEDPSYVPMPAGVVTIKPRDGLRLRLTALEG
ncbi:hypothetical protein W97_04850 [Coniosporium apollinis CBS 100218]|uniref:Cytochrome P450 oxidoreductase n=1 Tax=Coniosporium apollinis (strain CBS 100218) TaxID=1168221 RepID=R7YUQ1_CONA1|nr:uncharacterized protein W97_04850 [Coniosporium apollinis CBS 100218]EON65612.1 hypothetical protein W97_04850 [Coniosporium apollinis CBS 100218]